MTQTKPASPTKVVTGEVRFSYAKVFKPESVDGGDPKYSVALLIPKKDKDTLRKLTAAIKAVKADQKSLGTWGGKVPATLKEPLRDGDDERPDDDAYQGHWFLNASSGTKPGVVDENLQPITDSSEFYSGCYGRASIRLFAYSQRGNKGIGVALINLQKLRDGENLTGGSTPEEDFGDGYDPDDDPMLR